MSETQEQLRFRIFALTHKKPTQAADEWLADKAQLAELSKHANAMATSVGCTSKAFRDYWDYVEQKGVSSDE